MFYWKGDLPKEGDVIEFERKKLLVRKYKPCDKCLHIDWMEEDLFTRICTCCKLFQDGRVIAWCYEDWSLRFVREHCDYRKRKWASNRKWLAKMSDEELAEWLNGFKCGQGGDIPDDGVDSIKKWLGSEHKKGKKQ